MSYHMSIDETTLQEKLMCSLSFVNWTKSFQDLSKVTTTLLKFSEFVKSLLDTRTYNKATNAHENINICMRLAKMSFQLLMKIWDSVYIFLSSFTHVTDYNLYYGPQCCQLFAYCSLDTSPLSFSTNIVILNAKIGA